MQITLTDRQYERLQEVSEHTGLSIAELMRQAIEQRYGAMTAAERIAALNQAFGIWRDRTDIDPDTYLRDLRSGWGRRMKKLGLD